MIRQMRREVEAIMTEIQELSWFMRGSLQYHDGFDLIPWERRQMIDWLKDRLENEKGKMNPTY